MKKKNIYIKLVMYILLFSGMLFTYKIQAQSNFRFGFLDGYGQRSLHSIWEQEYGLNLLDYSATLIDELDIHWGREFILIYPMSPATPPLLYQDVLTQSQSDSLEAIMLVAVDSTVFFSDSLGYIQWLTDVVDGYPGIKYFQVHNEVGKTDRYENPDTYFQLLKCTGNTLKNYNPACKIIMGSTIPDSAYYNRLLSLGADNYVDAYDFHLFDDEEFAGLEIFLSSLNYFGINKPVFMTEMSTYSGQPLTASGIPNPRCPFQSEQTQAESLIKMFVRSFSLGVDYVFWNEFVEWYEFGGVIDGFFDLTGLVYNGLGTNTNEIPCVKKESYQSLKVLIEKIDQFISVQKINDGQYKFNVNNNSVYVFWSDSGSFTLPADLPDTVLVTDYQGNSSIMNVSQIVLNHNPVFVETDITTSIKSEFNLPIADDFLLFQNYPNPFNPQTTISYQLPVNGDVALKIYNMLGQEVCTLINENKSAGEYSVVWNGKNNSGQQLGSGVYFYSLELDNNNSIIKKLLLLK